MLGRNTTVLQGIDAMTLWSLLRSPAEQRIAGMPVPCSVALPDGQRIGSREPRLLFEIRDMRKAGWTFRAICTI